MRAKGFVQKDCAFAGHSLREYSALASIAGILHISALVDVVFYRGITMQRAVERDALNRSNYAMCAVNPSRISPSFTDAALREVVESIATVTSTLLEIVSFNVEVKKIGIAKRREGQGDAGEERPLKELAAGLGSTGSLGKYSTGLVLRLIGGR
ncbi:hypothetical protein EST38_g6989 [Candolleomyces aberdarensis]|uniref:Malonyl-CoA:ACP transacylase (MAT) domain-containing protein n=1 Tax=Candolleomyces aberdarensis TaxID=2316362 RepID=A0A4Q2DJM6_9AGAR|nr:hypothetical protein EST38_g6989 [Candolleomyces aberdarensis]